jgi:hypothetical protein
LLGGAAQRRCLGRTGRWVRAGKQKTDWTKPTPDAAYGDCIATLRNGAVLTGASCLDQMLRSTGRGLREEV